jgi:addiction module HigA family antidote
MPRPALHPGEILIEELTELGVTPTELSSQINVPPNRVTQIIHGRRGVAGDAALRLGYWLGSWRWGVKKVEENLSRLEASYVARNAKWNVSYPVFLNQAAQDQPEDDDVDDKDWDEDSNEYLERTTKPKSFWWGRSCRRTLLENSLN